jgi:hypothetical protein
MFLVASISSNVVEQLTQGAKVEDSNPADAGT